MRNVLATAASSIAIAIAVLFAGCGGGPRDVIDGVPPDAECVVQDIDLALEVAVWRCLEDGDVVRDAAHVVAYQAVGAMGLRGPVQVQRTFCGELTDIERGPDWNGGPACP